MVFLRSIPLSMLCISLSLAGCGDAGEQGRADKQQPGATPGGAVVTRGPEGAPPRVGPSEITAPASPVGRDELLDRKTVEAAATAKKIVEQPPRGEEQPGPYSTLGPIYGIEEDAREQASPSPAVAGRPGAMAADQPGLYSTTGPIYGIKEDAKAKARPAQPGLYSTTGPIHGIREKEAALKAGKPPARRPDTPAAARQGAAQE